MNNSCYIPLKFRNEILAHIVGVFSSKSNNFPLILGIFGNPGEGKTYMCEQLLSDFCVQRHDFSVGEFENEFSGIPVEKLREKYDKAVKNYVNHQVYSVLMINDIDTAIGNWGAMYQYTVNTQHIVGELMQISDPHGNQGARIPIIITGNNFNTIYTPLKRSGRIARFYWKPDQEDLVNIVGAKYTKLPQSEILKLIDTLNKYAAIKKLSETLPISFFTSLESKLYKQNIYILLEQQLSLSKTITLFNNQYQNQKVTIDELINVGKDEIDLIVATDKKHIGIEVVENGDNTNYSTN